MECGQCKDCRWWGDPEDEPDSCRACHMMTFNGCGTVDILGPIAETSMIKYIFFYFPDCDGTEEQKRWIKIHSYFPVTTKNSAKIVTSRFFGCVMFETREKV